VAAIGGLELLRGRILLPEAELIKQKIHKTRGGKLRRMSLGKHTPKKEKGKNLDQSP